MNRSKRRGFVLPLVIITTLLVAVLAAGLQTVVWNAMRQARLGFAGERALHTADAAIAGAGTVNVSVGQAAAVRFALIRFADSIDSMT